MICGHTGQKILGGVMKALSRSSCDLNHIALSVIHLIVLQIVSDDTSSFGKDKEMS